MRRGRSATPDCTNDEKYARSLAAALAQEERQWQCEQRRKSTRNIASEGSISPAPSPTSLASRSSTPSINTDLDPTEGGKISVKDKWFGGGVKSSASDGKQSSSPKRKSGSILSADKSHHQKCDGEDALLKRRRMGMTITVKLVDIFTQQMACFHTHKCLYKWT